MKWLLEELLLEQNRKTRTFSSQSTLCLRKTLQINIIAFVHAIIVFMISSKWATTTQLSQCIWLFISTNWPLVAIIKFSLFQTFWCFFRQETKYGLWIVNYWNFSIVIRFYQIKQYIQVFSLNNVVSLTKYHW